MKIVFALTVSMAVFIQAQDLEGKAGKQPMASRRVALIVQNHAPGAPDISMMALQDALTAKLSGRGFHVINPYNAVGVNQNRGIAGEDMPEASALDLARSLGAEGLVTASVIEFHDVRLGNPPVLRQYSMRLTLNVADASTGTTLCGETVKMKSPKYTNAQVAQNRHEYLGDLMFAVAEQCADAFLTSFANSNWKPNKSDNVTVYFGCNVFRADIQIDGLSYGTCPAELTVSRGVHTILVSCPPYYHDFRRRVLFQTDKQTYAVVLQRTPEGERQRRSGELFERQKEFIDAELARYKNAGEVDDYVRKTIADGTSLYWKNSQSRIVITDGTAQNIGFVTPKVDGGLLQKGASSTEIGATLRDLLKAK